MKITFKVTHIPAGQASDRPTYRAGETYDFTGPVAEGYARKYVRLGLAVPAVDDAPAEPVSDASTDGATAGDGGEATDDGNTAGDAASDGGETAGDDSADGDAESDGGEAADDGNTAGDVAGEDGDESLFLPEAAGRTGRRRR